MKFILIILPLVLVTGCSATVPNEHFPLTTVEKVDLNRYAGTWYEIASFPQWFQKGCTCTTAEYSIIDETTVRVVNKCRKDRPGGKLKSVDGKAFVVANSNNAKLKVRFFWPFKGDYWIIDLDENYQYAVVSAPNRKYLWILARSPEMDLELYEKIVDRAKAKGLDVTKLKKTLHGCTD